MPPTQAHSSCLWEGRVESQSLPPAWHPLPQPHRWGFSGYWPHGACSSWDRWQPWKADWWGHSTQARTLLWEKDAPPTHGLLSSQEAGTQTWGYRAHGCWAVLGCQLMLMARLVTLQPEFRGQEGLKGPEPCLSSSCRGAQIHKLSHRYSQFRELC